MSESATGPLGILRGCGLTRRTHPIATFWRDSEGADERAFT